MQHQRQSSDNTARSEVDPAGYCLSHGLGIRQVQAYFALARHCSYTKAARELNMTHSALSRLIVSLEREVGVALFVRTSSVIKLSPAGQAFQPFANRLAECYANTFALTHTAWPSKQVLACASTLITTLLCLLRNRRQASHPEVLVNAMSSHKVIEAVSNGHADAGICMAGEIPEYLEVEILLSSPLGLLAGPGVSLPRELKSHADLENLPFVRLGDDMVLPRLLKSKAVNLPAYFDANVISDSMPSLMNAVAAGGLVTIVSEVAARVAGSTGLVFRPLPALLPHLSLCLVTRFMGRAPNHLPLWRSLAGGLTQEAQHR